jgi:CubicO group peptidase (beta-lactamase class C family)
MGMGLGFQVVREPVGVTAMLSPGTFGHGGAHGTQGWIDPVKKTIHIMLIQRAGLKNGDASPMRQAFQDAAAAVLSKPE